MASSNRPTMSASTYTNYFQFRKTVVEMLIDRRYDAAAELVSSIPDFCSRFGKPQNLNPNSLGFRVSHLSDPTNTLQVVFPGHGHVSARQLSIMFNYQIKDQANLKKLLIVMFPTCEIESSAMNLLQDWPFQVEIMDETNLLYNPVKYDNGWKEHKVLTEDEKTEIVNKYNSEGREIPLIEKTHRLALYYALEEGQVLKITKVRAGIEDPERETFLLVN